MVSQRYVVHALVWLGPVHFLIIFSPRPMKDDLDLSVRPSGRKLIWYQDKDDYDIFASLAFDSIPNAKKEWAEYITVDWPPEGSYEVCVTTFRQIGDADKYTLNIFTWTNKAFSATKKNDKSDVWCTTYNFAYPP